MFYFCIKNNTFKGSISIKLFKSFNGNSSNKYEYKNINLILMCYIIEMPMPAVDNVYIMFPLS